MPNWCSNELIINGPHAEKIINNLGSKEFPVLDFNKIIPMPKHQTDPHKPNPFFAEGGFSNEIWKKFGTNNWYEWSITHWGTKWNASDAVKEPEENKIMFETAWSPPDQIAQALSEQCTNHEIILKYDEPGMDFSGTMIYKDGILVSDEQGTSTWNNVEDRIYRILRAIEQQYNMEDGELDSFAEEL